MVALRLKKKSSGYMKEGLVKGEGMVYPVSAALLVRKVVAVRGGRVGGL